MESLLSFDEQLFFLVNGEWSNAFFDAILPTMRNKLTWVPLYILVAGFLVWKYKMQSIPIILLAAATVGLADFVSSSMIKQWVVRPRPCNTPELAEQIRLLIECGPGYSFTSSHAANHFALAAFFGFFFKKMRWIAVAGFIWAGIISYSQVYVGVHYPLDVFFGAVLGVLIGVGGCWILNQVVRKFFLLKKSVAS